MEDVERTDEARRAYQGYVAAREAEQPDRNLAPPE
jgi:hypothetical protein